MRLKSIVAALAALMFAVPLAAQAPAPTAEPAPSAENIWYLDLSNGGQVAVQLRPDVAPQHVERIKTLTRQGFYNGIIFHRVIDGFMAQTGDPKGTGEGGSTLSDLKAEFNNLPHLRGTVSMARTDNPDSANSQFFIMFIPRFSLDHRYTVFGRVMSGMAYIDAIERGEPPANPTRIVRATLGADPAPATAAASASAPQAATPPTAPEPALPATAVPAAPAPEPAAPAQAPAPPAPPAVQAPAPAAPAESATPEPTPAAPAQEPVPSVPPAAQAPAPAAPAEPTAPAPAPAPAAPALVPAPAQ